MRYFIFSIGILLVAGLAWVVLPHNKLPYISFPKGAQHNTFGELPIVEMADDGNFFEIDGEEYNTKNGWYYKNSKGESILIGTGIIYFEGSYIVHKCKAPTTENFTCENIKISNKVYEKILELYKKLYSWENRQ